jgi:hypothetical protein
MIRVGSASRSPRSTTRERVEDLTERATEALRALVADYRIDRFRAAWVAG